MRAKGFSERRLRCAAGDDGIIAGVGDQMESADALEGDD